jgi:beta-galactosidase GanA
MAGISVDFISSHELERISEYAMVYLPALLIVNEKRAGILKDYVSHGGQLIAEGGTGQRDANSWLHTTRPGAGMAELFGLIEVERVVDDLEKRTLMLPTGEAVNSPYINAVFQVTTAKILAEYQSGGAAITENAFGKGMAMMTGFSPGLAYLNEPNPAWIKWIGQLARQNGLAQPVSAFSKTGIHVRMLESDEGTIYFLFNQSDRTQRWKSPGAGIELINGMKYAQGDNIELIAGQTCIVMSCVKDSGMARDRKDGKACLTTNTMS